MNPHPRIEPPAASLAFALALLGACVPHGACAADGEALYLQRCAACHDHPRQGLPARSALAAHTVEFIVDKVTFGSMQSQALGLDDGEIEAIARYLAAEKPAPQPGPDADKSR